MLIPFVIRVASAPLADGVLAGQVEHVPTGERCSFADAAQLTAWCAVYLQPDSVEVPAQAAASADERRGDLHHRLDHSPYLRKS